MACWWSRALASIALARSREAATDIERAAALSPNLPIVQAALRKTPTLLAEPMANGR